MQPPERVNSRMWTTTAHSSGPGDDLAVRDQEPAVVAGSPAVPARGDPREVRRVGEAVLQSLLGERGMQHALSPDAGLPSALLPGGVEPVAAGGSNIGEARRLCPRDQPAAGVGLCSVAAGDDDQTIDLGQVSSSAVANGGTSTPIPFYIHLENCSVDTANTVSTTFTGADSSVDGAVLGVTGSATDVGIVMTDGDSNTITLGEATAGQTLQNGDNTLAYSAYIIGGEAPTEGDFTGVTNWTLAYE